MTTSHQSGAGLALLRVFLLVLLLLGNSYLWSLLSETSFAEAFVAVVKLAAGFVLALVTAACLSVALRGKGG
ncbi:hypothetical protein ACS9ZN_03350 [Stenotrophomonas pavanii]